MQSIQTVSTASYCLATPKNFFAAKVPFLPVIGIRKAEEKVRKFQDRQSEDFLTKVVSMKNILALVFATLVLLTLSACHTISGAGQDMSAAGQDVTHAAHKVQRSMSSY